MSFLGDFSARIIARRTSVVLLSALFLSFFPFSFVTAQCVDPVADTVIESEVAATGRGSAVAVRDDGDFLFVWATPPSGGLDSRNMILTQRYCRDAVAFGSPAALTDMNVGTHQDASVAISRSGKATAGWTGIMGLVVGVTNMTKLQNDFEFDNFGAIIPTASPPHPGQGDHEPSVGASDAIASRATLGFSNHEENQGLHYALDQVQQVTLRGCPDFCLPRTQQWQPCVSTRSEDGITAITFAFDENPNQELSPLNVALMIFDSQGQLIDQLAGPDINDPDFWVNDPSSEDPSPEVRTSQTSPAISFVGNDLVVSWVGPDLAACQGTAVNHVFVRRFKFDDQINPGTLELRDPHPAAGEGRAGMFVVDNAPGMNIGPITARPTVALTLATDDRAGSFFVAWNAEDTGEGRTEIRGQYFDRLGGFRGPEFRVNQDTAVTLPPSINRRTLARSAQHTIAYGAQGQVVATWSPSVGPAQSSPPNGVFFTYLPPQHVETVCAEAVCLKGDANDDALVDLADVTPFTEALLFGLTDVDGCTVSVPVDTCRFDMNGDCLVNGLDIQCFVDTVLGRACTEPLRMIDCNSNEVEDSEDIALGTSFDVNTNGIPDECEADCNGNGTPDDWDIAQHTSVDCDASGRPDECESDCNGNGVNDACDADPADPDGNGLVSADCNASGIPDECEFDCNSNGVPDDCDVDLSDPDGDLLVSTDCNANGNPDECDIALPPGFGSLDCNTNGIPDECDIAACESDPACDDCNANGIPDGCDIAAQISEDADSNGIPDECESQQAQGGGGGELSSMSGGSESEASAPGQQEDENTGESPVPQDAAWAEFYDWCLTQDWGPAASIPTDQQFANMVAKLHELGLPLINPAIAALSP
jgi:hypothetical protein